MSTCTEIVSNVCITISLMISQKHVLSTVMATQENLWLKMDQYNSVSLTFKYAKDIQTEMFNSPVNMWKIFQKTFMSTNSLKNLYNKLVQYKFHKQMWTTSLRKSLSLFTYKSITYSLKTLHKEYCTRYMYNVSDHISGWTMHKMSCKQRLFYIMHI